MFRFNKLVFDIGGMILALSSIGIYAQAMYMYKVNDFLAIAATVFAGLATICGLALGFAANLEDTDDKKTASNASEKLLMTTLLFLFSALLGLFAMKMKDLIKIDWLASTVSIILKIFGYYLLTLAIRVGGDGINWLSDLLWKRWQNRIM